jgi:Zn-dependent M28 family amino/carboxypeptidase
MAAWLDSLSHALADTVVVQRWNHVTAGGDSLPMINVIARFNPETTTRVLYVAHWDTRPRADADSSGPTDQPIAGANDGASGVAVLLGVMDALAARPPTIGVDLLFVDGEDYGFFVPEPVDVLIGSEYYARNQLPPARPDFAVVWDMVGAANLRLTKEPQSAVAAPDVIDLVWDTAERLGYGHVFVQEAGQTITDDHLPLIRAGIRAIDVIGWPYPHWHTLEDTADKLAVESLEAVGNVAVAVIREVDRN